MAVWGSGKMPKILINTNIDRWRLSDPIDDCNMQEYSSYEENDGTLPFELRDAAVSAISKLMDVVNDPANNISFEFVGKTSMFFDNRHLHSENHIGLCNSSTPVTERLIMIHFVRDLTFSSGTTADTTGNQLDSAGNSQIRHIRVQIKKDANAIYYYKEFDNTVASRRLRMLPTLMHELLHAIGMPADHSISAKPSLHRFWYRDLNGVDKQLAAPSSFPYTGWGNTSLYGNVRHYYTEDVSQLLYLY